MQVTGHPAKLAPYIFGANIRIDLVNGGEPGVPHCFRAILPKLVHQFVQTRVSDARQVSGRVSGVDRSAASALDERHGVTGFLEEVSGGNAGDSCSDDNYVYL